MNMCCAEVYNLTLFGWNWTSKWRHRYIQQWISSIFYLPWGGNMFNPAFVCLFVCMCVSNFT